MRNIITVLIILFLAYSCSNDLKTENENSSKFLTAYIDSLESDFEENIRFDSLKYYFYYASYISYKEYSDSLKMLYNSDNLPVIDRVKIQFLEKLRRFSHWRFENPGFININEHLIDNKSSYSKSEFVNALLVTDMFAINEINKEMNGYEFRFDVAKAHVDTDFSSPRLGDSLGFTFSILGTSPSLSSKIKVLIEQPKGSENENVIYDTIQINGKNRFELIHYETVARKKGVHSLKGIYLYPLEYNRYMRLKFNYSYEVN